MIGCCSQTRPSALVNGLPSLISFPEESGWKAGSQPKDAAPYINSNMKNSRPPDLRVMPPFSGCTAGGWLCLLAAQKATLYKNGSCGN